MPVSRPLSSSEQALVNAVKLTHQTLAVARKTRNAELSRRVALEKERIRIEAQRLMDEAEHRLRLELDYEVAQHEAAQDAALIEAYNGGVPMTRIAIDGFGNRYPGGVNQLIVKLRNEGLLGNSVGYQRNEETDELIAVEFPQPVDIDAILSEATTIKAPGFEVRPDLELVPADKNGENAVMVDAVLLTMDARDPYFKQIAANARPDTPYKHETTAMLYLHPATGELKVFAHDEVGSVLWDHPVSRWVKEHPEEARAGFDAALAC